MAKVTLLGGPCDGVQLDFGAGGVTIGATTVCGNHVYRAVTSTTMRDQGAVPYSPNQGIPHKADAFRAWSKLMHTVGHDIPAQMRRSAQARRRIRRAGR